MIFIRHVSTSDLTPCSSCGTGPSEIGQTGRVGCPECYRHFASRLTSYIRRVHGPAYHTGSIPTSASEQIQKRRKLAELRQKLRGAVENQEFERCALLRDEIKALSGEEDSHEQ